MSLILLVLLLGLPLDTGADTPLLHEVQQALRETPRLAPKGRVQDAEYNPSVPIVELVRRRKEQIIPVLIELIASEEPLDPVTLDYWPEVHVGDVAFIVLVDLFQDNSWEPVAPELSWRELLEVAPEERSTGYEQFSNFVSSQGRGALQRKWRSFWGAPGSGATWNERCRCFLLAEVPE